MHLLRGQIRFVVATIAGGVFLLFAAAQVILLPRTGDPHEFGVIVMLAITTAGLAVVVRKVLDAGGHFSMRLILITVALAASWSLLLRWSILLSS